MFLSFVFFWGREDEDKGKEENGQTFFLFKTALLDIYSKNSTHSLFCAWSFVLVHIWYTPSERPKGFLNSTSKKLKDGSRTMANAIFHGPWCKSALS